MNIDKFYRAVVDRGKQRWRATIVVLGRQLFFIRVWTYAGFIIARIVVAKAIFAA